MNNKVLPITPDEVKQEFPNYVIEGANNCIKKYWQDLYKKSEFSINQLIDEIENAYFKYNKEVDEINYNSFKNDLYKNHYLDIEPIYRDAGWEVICDVPGYCESYATKFIFKKKK